MRLSEQAHKDFTAHVLAEYPKEACGLVVGNSYIPCKNIHPEPEKHFRISPEEMVLSQAEMPLEAILHSHPYKGGDRHPPGWRPEFPSASDIDHFNKSGVPWGIAATDGGGLSELVWLDDKERPPLHGRYFIWGVQDCYSLVRDWFWQERKINLINVPRQWDWWSNKESPQLFEEWFEKAGFYIIPPKDATIGDVALMRMGVSHSPEVINHCGVITGHNELLHQGYDPFYSRTVRQDHWQKSIAKYIRYRG